MKDLPPKINIQQVVRLCCLRVVDLPISLTESLFGSFWLKTVRRGWLNKPGIFNYILKHVRKCKSCMISFLYINIIYIYIYLYSLLEKTRTVSSKNTGAARGNLTPGWQDHVRHLGTFRKIRSGWFQPGWFGLMKKTEVEPVGCLSCCFGRGPRHCFSKSLAFFGRPFLVSHRIINILESLLGKQEGNR